MDNQPQTELLARIAQLENENRTLSQQIELQEQIAKSDRLVNAYYDISNLGVLVALPNLSIIHANQRFCEIIGYSEEEVRSMTWSDITTPEDFQQEHLRYKKALANSKLLKSHFITKFVRKDQSLVDVEITTTFIRDSNGKVEQLIAVVQDLTEKEMLEQSIAESQNRFKELVELLPQTVFETDANGVFSFVNGYALKELGYKAEVIIGKMSFLQTVVEQERAMALDGFKNNQTFGTVGREYTLLRSDGSTFKGLVHYSPILKENLFLGIRGIVTNINNLKEIEAKLEESEQRFRELVDLLPQTVYETDSLGVFTFVNSYAQQEFGYSESELIGRLTFMDMLSEEDRLVVANQISIDIPETVVGNEYHMKRKDGTHFKGLVHFRALSSLGKFAGFRGIVTNISTQKIAEQQLRESEVNYRTIFELASDSIIVHDAHTSEVIDANRSAIESYGLSSLKELQNYGFWNVSPYGFEEAVAWVQKAVNEGEQVFEWFNKRIDGTTFWEEVHLTTITILGKKRVISIGRDITNRKQIEDALQEMNRELKDKNEEYASLNEEYQAQNEELQLAKEKAEESDKLKSAFLANMSHEIRTPMNAIMGFSGLLASGKLNAEKQATYSLIIKRRSADFLKIIDDILDISKIESNQIVLQKTSGDLHAVLDEILEFYTMKRELEPTKPIEFRLSNLLGANQQIFADFGRLRQVILNLVENAYKFTDEGFIEIGCRSANGSITFWVADSGVGIEPQLQNIIFERFRQAHDRTTQTNSGTGLGLSICKGLVQLMGGTIWVESNVGKGSTFFFTIPMEKANVSGTVAISAKSYIANIRGKTILVVEDDEVSQRLLADMLAPYKAKLLFASNGSEAHKTMQQYPSVSAILLDVRLPDCDGLTLIKGFRTINRDVIIVGQSAYATHDDRMFALHAGCDTYITKPIDKEDLINTLTCFLNKPDRD